MILRPPSPTLFPYTTLFRSRLHPQVVGLLHSVRDNLHDREKQLLGDRLDRKQRQFPQPPALGLETLQETHLGSKSPDRKSTRLNSSHVETSYAVFCLKKKKH